jgi:ADP-ribosyl-[dinitrogen reductase] hydrolase
MMDKGKVVGAFLGLAIGDALGMPVEGLGHQNTRLYYKGIKEYRDDEKRGGLKAGQWTGDTQLTLALAEVIANEKDPLQWPFRYSDAIVRLLPEQRRWGGTTISAARRLSGIGRPESHDDLMRATCGAIPRLLPLAAWVEGSGQAAEEVFDLLRALIGVTHTHPLCAVAGAGHLAALGYCFRTKPSEFVAGEFWQNTTAAVMSAEDRLGISEALSLLPRLQTLKETLDEFPLDLADVCEGGGNAVAEAWPFAIAMVARTSHLPEAALLSGINACVDSDSVGAMTGSLIGALHGNTVFPASWIENLEASGKIEQIGAQAWESLETALRRPDFRFQNDPMKDISG